MTDCLTCGVHHVGLAVPNIDAAEMFFRDALGWRVTRRLLDYPAVFVTDGTILLTLWRVADPAASIPFNRHANVGLHHLALSVGDNDALEQTYSKVRHHPGVTIEFNPQPIRLGAATRHFICAMPGGVRIEFATPLA